MVLARMEAAVSDLLKAALKTSTAITPQIEQAGKKKLVTTSVNRKVQPQLIGSIHNCRIQQAEMMSSVA